MFQRAKVFACSCFSIESDSVRDEITINFLMTIVREAEENKLRKFLDPERFKIEQIFNELIR